MLTWPFLLVKFSLQSFLLLSEVPVFEMPFLFKFMVSLENHLLHLVMEGNILQDMEEDPSHDPSWKTRVHLPKTPFGKPVFYMAFWSLQSWRLLRINEEMFPFWSVRMGNIPGTWESHALCFHFVGVLQLFYILVSLWLGLSSLFSQNGPSGHLVVNLGVLEFEATFPWESLFFVVEEQFVDIVWMCCLVASYQALLFLDWDLNFRCRKLPFNDSCLMPIPCLMLAANSMWCVHLPVFVC